MKSVKIVSNQAALVGGSKRFGDQIGMIIAGIWHLKTSAVIDETNAREMIKRYQSAKADDMSDYSRTEILEWFMQQELSFNMDDFRSVFKAGEAIEILLSNSDDWAIQKKQKTIASRLAMQGLIVEKETKSIIVSTSKGMTICKIFSGSLWGEAGWKDAIMRIPGADRVQGRVEFGSLSKTNAIKIPLEPQE